MPNDGPHPQPTQILLQPLDRGSEALCRDLVRRVSRRVILPCRLSTEPFEHPFPKLRGGEQVNADRLFRLVADSRPSENVIIVGVTRFDMGTGLFAYQFGRAEAASQAVIVSWARLCPTWYGEPDDPETTLRRATLETAHELGHVWGLPHCHDYACLMRFAPTVEAIDNRGTGLCKVCQAHHGGGLRA